MRGDYLERTEALVAAGVDALVLDIAHGHADSAIDAVRELKAAWPDTEVVAGNVATGDGVVDLVDGGRRRDQGRNRHRASPARPGSSPGVGVPQLTAVLDCAAAARASGVPIVADGGIRRPGDVAKAIAAGASSVMVGSLFAGREESPGDVVRRRGQLFKVYRGMASRSAAAARLAIEGRDDALDQYVAEGEEMEFPLRGPVAGGVRGSRRRAAERDELRQRVDDPRVLGARELRPPDRGRASGSPTPARLVMSTRLFADALVVTMDDARHGARRRLGPRRGRRRLGRRAAGPEPTADERDRRSAARSSRPASSTRTTTSTRP